MLIWNGKTLDRLPPLTGANSDAISALAPFDAFHLWLASGDDSAQGKRIPGGLFLLDTRTLAAVPQPLPPLLAAQAVTQIFQAGGDWYLTAQDSSHQIASVWRKREGTWQKSIPLLEEPGQYYQQSSRVPWLAEPSGLWVGAGGGLWWLPRTDKPALWVNWRRGVMALNMIGLFPLPSGRVLVFGQASGSAEMPATPQPVRPLPPGVSVGGFGAPQLFSPPLADLHQHFWGLTDDKSGTSRALAEWDGQQWRTHRVPKTVEGAGSLYACDTRGRIWLTTSVWHPPAQPQPVEGRAVYDPARDLWTDYAAPQEALAAAAALPGMGFRPYSSTSNLPVFSGDGRVTYADNNTTIVLYDGKTWRHWQTGEILTNYGGNVPNLLHFNAAGHLEIGFGGPRCEWTLETGWQRNGEQEAVVYQSPVPPGGPKGLWSSPTTDSLGIKWFVWNGGIYTAGYGLWTKQPELSAPDSPFRLGFNLENVLQDPAGRLFFVSRPAGSYKFVVWTPPAVPEPHLAVTPTADDAVTVRVQSELRGPHWYLWRLNGGAWSAPTTAKTQVFTGLPHGEYRLEVQALDSRLQLSPVAAAAWSVQVAPASQIAGWVSALNSGPDAAREAAVAGLIKQPLLALPALKAARPAASDLGKWWIDAAIQQITEGFPAQAAN